MLNKEQIEEIAKRYDIKVSYVEKGKGGVVIDDDFINFSECINKGVNFNKEELEERIKYLEEENEYLKTENIRIITEKKNIDYIYSMS